MSIVFSTQKRRVLRYFYKLLVVREFCFMGFWALMYLKNLFKPFKKF
jgi:hypothetical protein